MDEYSDGMTWACEELLKKVKSDSEGKIKRRGGDVREKREAERLERE